MPKEYIKSLEDEIDWKLIDQLHSATLNFSQASLELKKLFFVLLGISVPTLIKLAGDKLDLSLFVTIYILIFAFWFLDSFTFYYQEKLRTKMDVLFNSIKQRNKENLLLPENLKQEFTIEGTKRTQDGRLLRSIFNGSVSFYIILLALNSLGLILLLNHTVK